MYLLPRGGNSKLNIVPHAGKKQRGLILFTLLDGSIGVSLSAAASSAGKEIVNGSEPFSDGTVQKHTLCINVGLLPMLLLADIQVDQRLKIATYSPFSQQKYAYNTKDKYKSGKTYTEVAKQVAEVTGKFFSEVRHL